MIDQATVAGLAFDDDTADAQALKPDPLGKLHQSKTGLYRVTQGIDREIGLSTGRVRGEAEEESGNDPTQQGHPSALTRWDADAKYRPRGLREYFARLGDGEGR